MYLYYLLALGELDKIELEHVLGFEYDKKATTYVENQAKVLPLWKRFEETDEKILIFVVCHKP